MSKRFALLASTTWAVTAAAALALAGGASGAPAVTLPTVNVALNGTQGITVSGSTLAGAVNITSTFSGTAPGGGKGGPAFGLVRLNPGATAQQALTAVVAAKGDLNALNPYGALLVDASAPGTVQAVLTPGTWAAVNFTGNGQPGIATFTVSPSVSPAPLPTADATQTAIDFAFRGPNVLRTGTVVRAQNNGYVVHMITGFGVKNAATGRQVMALLRAGKDKKAQKLANKSSFNLLGPTSTGAVQQQVLNAKPGLYVEACFMNAQDGREHTQLGMERMIRVTK